jgi:murein L,D-transpeptidase YcbB/YkuD
MLHNSKKLLVFVFSFILFPVSLLAVGLDLQIEIQDQIRLRLENNPPGQRFLIRNQYVFAPGEIHAFYANRVFQQAWSSKGELTEQAYELRFEIKQAQFDGLDPFDYKLAILESFFTDFEASKAANKTLETIDLVDFDLFMSDAFFQLATHLEIGKVNPANLSYTWDIPRKVKKVNYAQLLNLALENNTIRKSLESLYPPFEMYRKSREVIRLMEKKNKSNNLDWKTIKLDKSLKVGESVKMVSELRKRLMFWDFLPWSADSGMDVYDSMMMQAVQIFQSQNGMNPDGVIGKMTLDALNQSPRKLIDKGAVNLERMRWLSDLPIDSELIVVNIPNFQVNYIYKKDTIFTSKVIVGTKKHSSPVFTAQMRYIVFSPYWNVPNSIVRNELIPIIRRNPTYLTQKNMEVLTPSGQVLNPANLSWSPKSFPYLIRQKPGEDNALGLVKFMFPNPYSVYLHDTPSKSLFERDDRAFSHGCIRLQNPFKFAQILLLDRPEWNAENIQKAMGQPKEQIVNLQREIPVVILYLTFWVDSKGIGQFRPDIYERDREVLMALRR